MDVGNVEDVSKFCIEFVQVLLSGLRPLSTLTITQKSSGQRGFAISPWIERSWL